MKCYSYFPGCCMHEETPMYDTSLRIIHISNLVFPWQQIHILQANFKNICFRVIL